MYQNATTTIGEKSKRGVFILPSLSNVNTYFIHFIQVEANCQYFAWGIPSQIIQIIQIMYIIYYASANIVPIAYSSHFIQITQIIYIIYLVYITKRYCVYYPTFLFFTVPVFFADYIFCLFCHYNKTKRILNILPRLSILPIVLLQFLLSLLLYLFCVYYLSYPI